MMYNKLCTILMSAMIAVPTMAQQPAGAGESAQFAPQKGQWEVSLMLGGSNSFYNENAGSYLISNPQNGAIGLPNGGTDASGSLNQYLNINGYNNNSIINVIGVQGKYFIKDNWAVNLSFGLNFGVTPKKDYIEGDASVEDMKIPAQQYVNAQSNHNWYVNVGSDYYFKTRNPRISPYVGGLLGFQMARIEINEPYVGEVSDPDLDGELIDKHVLYSGGNAGQIYGFKVAAVAGIEYALTEGLFLGLECQPIAYRYDVVRLNPKGFDQYNVCHHNFKLMDTPMVKIGFRF